MTQRELLRHVVDVLERLGAPYMIGGSQASMYYGEPRATRDIDVVVELRAEDLSRFLSEFPRDEYYADEQAAREAIRTAHQFNIIHPTSGFKIDVYVNPDTPYDRARLVRRQRLPLVPGVDAYFARPEDVILYKLLYHQQVESGVHLRDVLGIIRVTGPELDEGYIRHWADRLGLRGLWDRVRRQADE
jgi:hypothetical protein